MKTKTLNKDTVSKLTDALMESKKKGALGINGTMVKQSPDAQLIRNPTPTTGTVRG